MGIVDDAKNKWQQARGWVEEQVGNLTDDEDLQNKGEKDQVVGEAKEAGQDVADKAGQVVEGVKDRAGAAVEEAKRNITGNNQ